MLSTQDRQRNFEQLRAHWEAAETRGDAKMVGRKEKHTAHHVVHADLQPNVGSKFRRKLSHGLALMSLTQRKSVPARQLSNNTSLVGTAHINNNSTAIVDHDALLSPLDSYAPEIASSNLPAALQNNPRPSGDLQTPRQLPRSHTFSYIPRPVKVDTDAKPTTELEQPSGSIAVTAMPALEPLLSRIPTPSSSQATRRPPSPRQNLPYDSTLQVRFSINRQSFTGSANTAEPVTAIRSRTTPNLVKATTTTQTTGSIALARPRPREHFTSSISRKSVLVENVPTSRSIAQRQSRGQNKAFKRESLAVPSTASNRRLVATGPLTIQSNRASLTTPVSVKYLDSQSLQTTLTARRVSTKNQNSELESAPPGPSEEAPFCQALLKSSEGSPTLALSTVDFVDSPVLSPLPSTPLLDIDDTTKRTLGTPNRLGGVWRSSEVVATANHQVRSVPTCPSSHHFGRRSKTLPLMTSTPNQRKLPTSPKTGRSVQERFASTSLPGLHKRFPIISGNFDSSRRSLLSQKAFPQMPTEPALTTSTSTLASWTTSDITRNTKKQKHIANAERTCDHSDGSLALLFESYGDHIQPGSFSKSSINLVALHAVKAKPVKRSTSTARSKQPAGGLWRRQSWSITEHLKQGSANDATRTQVKDYMPMLYWAGRFQSRFDHWRTEAMIAAINPEIKPEDCGSLESCNLDDERKAISLIFTQLKGLCASAPAADSLHEFEHKYRKDHKMLEIRHDLPPSLRKPEQATPKGPVGRAVRKLTPRKASFANLFKGKSWNRSNYTNTTDTSGHVRELQDITGVSIGVESADSGSSEHDS